MSVSVRGISSRDSSFCPDQSGLLLHLCPLSKEGKQGRETKALGGVERGRNRVVKVSPGYKSNECP